MLPSTILKVQHSNLELKSDIDSRLGILTCPDISRRWSCCKSSDRRMNKCFSFSVSSHDAKDICVIVNVFSYGFLFFQNLCSLSIKSIQCAFSSKSIQCATQEVHNMEGCLFIKKKSTINNVFSCIIVKHFYNMLLSHPQNNFLHHVT